MSSFVSTIAKASVTKTKIVQNDSGLQLQVFMTDGNAVFLDYADAVRIAEAVEDMRHEAASR